MTWAVGCEGGTSVHFDGNAWSLSDSGTTENLRAIRGAERAEDVWVTGDDGSVFHWNGMLVRDLRARNVAHRSVGERTPRVGLGARFAEAAGSGDFRHWDERPWGEYESLGSWM